MWQKLIDLARFAWDLGEDTRQNSKKIGELQEENEELTRTLQLAVFEIQRLRDEMGHLKLKVTDEQEKLELRLRLELSEKLRQLPPKD